MGSVFFPNEIVDLGILRVEVQVLSFLSGADRCWFLAHLVFSEYHLQLTRKKSLWSALKTIRADTRRKSFFFFFESIESIGNHLPLAKMHATRCGNTGGPSSSCEMIILPNNSHGGIIRVCMGIFSTALRNKKMRQIFYKNASPYFHSVSLVNWPLTTLKGTHFNELSISRFSTYTRKAQYTYWITQYEPRFERPP